MKKFEIPEKYRSGFIGRIKEWRRINDPRKKDFSPTKLDFGEVEILLPRHFGFCYGVENAIEISYKALEENPTRRIFLLSQMIHNPAVNEDLLSRGIQFIMDPEGKQFIPWDEVNSDDVVIIPAFGTTIATEQLLESKGVEIQKYNTTCPFVEKVWKRSAEIGQKGFTVIIHGKYQHEETRATFSHSFQNAPSIIVRNMEEAELLAKYVRKALPKEQFYTDFAKKYSEGFDPERDLQHVGVVNQTTMLASETQSIADYFKQLMREIHGENGDHFADTRDTLCYATNDNQEAILSVRNEEADLALVIGGHNSSNTSQLVTILRERMPVYYISGAKEIESSSVIHHFEYGNVATQASQNWLPIGRKPRIILASGASCPDTVVEEVMSRILGFSDQNRSTEDVLKSLSA